MHEIEYILKLFPRDCQPTQIESLGAAGGMSGAQFWRLMTPRGKLILRRWPQEHPTPERLRFIHAVLEHAAERGITFLPVPIRAATRESFVEHDGHVWELAHWMAGNADYECAPNTEKLQSAVQALAKFHTAVADFNSQPGLSLGSKAELLSKRAAQSPAIVRRLGMLHELQTGGIDKLSRAITPSIWPDLAPLVNQFLTRLPAAVSHAIAQLAPLADVSFPLQPCLRDIWHDHVLFTGDEVTGIIDFGAMDIDTPACDVARLLGSLVGDDATGWQSGLASYSAVRPLTSDEVRAVTTLDTSGTVLGGCNWLRWIYVEGRQFENQPRVIERFRKTVAGCSQPRSGDSA
jgi:Ser/Thr protein kinase RdoA (MazF antagonist)